MLFSASGLPFSAIPKQSTFVVLQRTGKKQNSFVPPLFKQVCFAFFVHLTPFSQKAQACGSMVLKIKLRKILLHSCLIIHFLLCI